MEARRCHELIRQAGSSRLNYVYTALVEIRKQFIKTAKGVEILTGAGLVHTLFELLKKRHSLEEQYRSKVIDLCMSILGNMCMEEVTRKMVLKLSAVSPLVDVLEEAETETLQNRACRCLANILLSPGSWELVHSSSMIERITKLLQDTENDECKQTYIRAVRLLGQTGHHVQALINKGTVSAVLKHIDCDTEAVNQSALRCIHNLCTHGNTPNLASQVVSSGKLDYLLTLTKQYSEQAFHVLVKLCDHHNFRPEFGNVGGISAFVELFRSEDECCETMWPEIISALCLCCKEAVNRAKLREQGALIIFLETLSSNKLSGLHSRIISAFVCFLYDQTSFGILLENKMVPVLINHLGNCFGHRRGCVEEVDEKLKEEVAKRDALIEKERKSQTEVKKACENSENEACIWQTESSKGNIAGDIDKGKVQRDNEEENKACNENNDMNDIQESSRNPGTEIQPVVDNKQEMNSNSVIPFVHRNQNVTKGKTSMNDEHVVYVDDVEMCDIDTKHDNNMDDMIGRCVKVTGEDQADDQSVDTADEDIDPATETSTTTAETSTPARPLYSIDSPTYESAMDTSDASYSNGAKCIEKFTPPHRVDWSHVGYSPPPPVNWAAGKVYSPISNLSYYSPNAGSPNSSPYFPGQGTSPGLQTGTTVQTCPSGYSPGHGNKPLDNRARHKYTGINSKLYNMSRSPVSSPERRISVDRLGASPQTGTEGDRLGASPERGRLCDRRRISRRESSCSEDSFQSDSSPILEMDRFEYSPVSSPPCIDHTDPVGPTPVSSSPRNNQTDPIGPSPVSSSPHIDQTDPVGPTPVSSPSHINQIGSSPVSSSPCTDPIRSSPVSNSPRIDPIRPSPVSSSPRTDPIGPSPVSSSPRTDPIGPSPVSSSPRTDPIGSSPVSSSPRTDPIGPSPVSSSPFTDQTRSSNSSLAASQQTYSDHDTSDEVKLKYDMKTNTVCSMQNNIMIGKDGSESGSKDEIQNSESLLENDTVKVKSRSVIFENNILILLSAVSQMPDPSMHLVTKEVLSCILGYIGRMESPLARAARVMSRVLRNPLCFDKLLSLHAPIVIYSQLLQYTHLDELLSLRSDKTVAGRRGGVRGQSLDDSSDSDRFSMTDDSMAEEDFKSAKSEDGGFTSRASKKHAYKGVYHKQEEEVCDAGKCGIAFLSDLASVADTLYGRGVVTRLLILAQPYNWLSIHLSVPYIIRAAESRLFYINQLKLLEQIFGILLERRTCCSFTFLTIVRGISFLMKNICSKSRYTSQKTCRARHKRAISRVGASAGGADVGDKSLHTRRETDTMETTGAMDTDGCCLASSQVDITFIVQGEKLPACKSVLIQRSEIFAAMLEGHYLEARQSTVTISETSVYAFQYLLHHLHGCSSCHCHMMKSLHRDNVSKQMAENCIEILVESDKFFLTELHSEVKQCLFDRYIIPDSAFSVFKYSILRGWDDYLKAAVVCTFLDSRSESKLIEKLEEFLRSEYAEVFTQVLANVLIE